MLLFPFPTRGRLGNIPIEVRLIAYSNPRPVLTTLAEAIIRVNDSKVDDSWIREVPTTILAYIWQSYTLAVTKWYTFCEQEMSKMVSDPLIRGYWILVQNHLPDISSQRLEISLWILYNHRTEKAEQLKLITDLRDSLLPWLQPEIWKKIQDRDVRKNVLYEKQHAEMQAGIFSAKEDDNLDIIE